MSKQARQTMTEAEFEALCAWLEGPAGCNFRQEIPGESESLTWTCDGTLKLTRPWMRAHGINEATTIPELEARGGYCDCEVLFNVADAPREWLRSGD